MHLPEFKPLTITPELLYQYLQVQAMALVHTCAMAIQRFSMPSVESLLGPFYAVASTDAVGTTL